MKEAKLLLAALLLIPAISGEMTAPKLPYLPVSPAVSSPALLDVGAIAKVLTCECRNQPPKGMAYVAGTLQNRAADWGGTIHEQSRSGYCKTAVLPSLWPVAVRLANSTPIHPFKYFLAPKTAKNRQMLDLLRHSESETVAGHVFF